MESDVDIELLGDLAWVCTLVRSVVNLFSIVIERCDLISVIYLAGPLREECTPSVVGISEVTAKSILQISIVGGQHLSFVRNSDQEQ